MSEKLLVRGPRVSLSYQLHRGRCGGDLPSTGNPTFSACTASLGLLRRTQAEAGQVEGGRRAFSGGASPLRASPQQKQRHFSDTL